jgi:hypothetical protein
MIKHLTWFLFLCTGVLYSEESGDIFLDSNSPNGYTLNRGVMQIGAYTSYVNLDLAKIMGSDIDASSANGVGEFSDKGGQIWFGLTNKLTAHFNFSMSDFKYRQREANVSFQELRLKRALFTDHDSIGFLTLEAGWRRHSTNKLTNSGIVNNNLSNVLHDNGWSLRLEHTKPFLAFDFHTRLGYNRYDKDGNNGQKVTELAVGLSKFWANRNQVDFYVQQYRISRNSPNFSVKDKDTNNIIYLSYKRHINNHWALDSKVQLNDNLFRGYWPFIDREISSVGFSKYGYLTLGLTYRFNYSE